MGSAPILDSGASHHMTGDRELFHILVACGPLRVQMADGRWANTGMELSVHTDKENTANNCKFALLEVDLVVGFRTRLSLSAHLQGYDTLFHGDACTVTSTTTGCVAMLYNRNRGI